MRENIEPWIHGLLYIYRNFWTFFFLSKAAKPCTDIIKKFATLCNLRENVVCENVDQYSVVRPVHRFIVHAEIALLYEQER